MTMKNNIKWSFQPAQWLSSAEEEDLGFCFQNNGSGKLVMVSNTDYWGVDIIPICQKIERVKEDPNVQRLQKLEI